MYIAEIERNIIIKSLNIINFIIEKNPLLPILKNLLIKKTDENIYFIANNLNIQIKIYIKHNIKNKTINVCVSIKKFLNIIKNFPNNKILLKISKNNKLLIKYNKIKFLLDTLVSVNYPKIKRKKKYKIKLNIKQNFFLNLINSIYFAMDIKNNNYSTNGMLLYTKSNNIKGITTDNYRLAYYAIKTENNYKKFKVIIPSKTILLMKNLLSKDSNNELKIFINKDQIKFNFNNIEILSKLIEGGFPKLKNKIYNKYKNNFIINKLILESALKRSLSIIEKNFYLTKWIIKNNTLKIITENNNEKGNEEIIIKQEGSNIDIYINIKYIVELLHNTEENQIKFNFSNQNKNIIIMFVENNNFKYILTPIKT